ncbi:hypothetical protein BJ508DRAFT_359980 [Ascobolus immersus RN42]|uniref:Ankyrin n=1 Tax=Ascobolus immersus RN42 TaxID=1160509 RepID=A0A3N4ICV6_ASCIM|nr:hypothetical protein BJ508DRAFT_359980 [Ascobolus immersus RN42]
MPNDHSENSPQTGAIFRLPPELHRIIASFFDPTEYSPGFNAILRTCRYLNAVYSELYHDWLAKVILKETTEHGHSTFTVRPVTDIFSDGPMLTPPDRTSGGTCTCSRVAGLNGRTVLRHISLFASTTTISGILERLERWQTPQHEFAAHYFLHANLTAPRKDRRSMAEQLAVTEFLCSRLGPEGLNKLPPSCLDDPLSDLINDPLREEHIDPQHALSLARCIVAAGLDTTQPPAKFYTHYYSNYRGRHQFNVDDVISTYLHMAVNRGNLAMTKFLVLECGADPNGTGPNPRCYATPLNVNWIPTKERESSHGLDRLRERMEIVRFLVSQGADINGGKGPDGMYDSHPLNIDDMRAHRLARDMRGDESRALFCQLYIPDPDRAPPEGNCTPLLVEYDYTVVFYNIIVHTILELFESGAAPNLDVANAMKGCYGNRSGFDSLIPHLIHNYHEDLGILSSPKLQKEASNWYTQPLLQCQSKVSLLRRLIAAGCDVNATVEERNPYVKFTLLEYVEQRGLDHEKEEIIKTLLAGGARIGEVAKTREC